MFKNQLQELAQRSCFNLPSYACVREGPDHAPRFKASVNFNGEVFESPSYSTTLRQAEHAAAEAALSSLSARGPSKSLTARVLDETGVYKNLLQETAHRAGLKLPIYTTVRSGPGHVPVFTSTVELAGISFSGEPAKTKKQAEKNAAIAAWFQLKQMPNLGILSEQENAGGGKWSCSSNSGRVIRRRDYHHHHQPRMQRPIQRDSFAFAQKRPILDPTHKHRSFLSLLPPPPLTASKILPPNLPNSKTLTPKATVKETLPMLEEFFGDDQEWVNKISEAIRADAGSSKSIYGGKIGGVYSQFGGEDGRIRSIPPPLMKIPSTCHNPQIVSIPKFAPAVQIRSVIPVCAAPPVRVNSDQSLPINKAAPPPAPSSEELAVASSLSKLKI
ncbi:double-stranded RNA-binding protein 3 [Salvia hispanica]|uniref:double-stranded RNA-binding protein 3 n=1 Tax=Salvia hispanica TaxID=49212 RepID=UPI0020092F72|nr:double-stranded RNA-binding protein 3 [Salvia hispanica]